MLMMANANAVGHFSNGWHIFSEDRVLMEHVDQTQDQKDTADLQKDSPGKTQSSFLALLVSSVSDLSAFPVDDLLASAPATISNVSTHAETEEGRNDESHCDESLHV